MIEDEPTWLNRCAIFITPKAPYVAWASAVFDEPYVESEEDGEHTVFLGPDADTTEEVQAFIDENFDLFFDYLLNDWCLDQTSWPANRTVEMFRQWFTVRVYSMVVDTVDGPLELE